MWIQGPDLSRLILDGMQQGRQELKAGSDILRISTSPSTQDGAFLWISSSSEIPAISSQKSSPKPQASKA